MLAGVPSCWWWCGRCVIFHRALLTSAPFRSVAAWRIVQHTCFGGRHVHVAPTLCCLVSLFYFLVLGRAKVPYSICMHFAKCFGACNVQLTPLGGSCARCFSVSVLPFSTSPNSGVKVGRGFLRSENTILPFFLLAVSLFLGFLTFFCFDRATLDGTTRSVGHACRCIYPSLRYTPPPRKGSNTGGHQNTTGPLLSTVAKWSVSPTTPASDGAITLHGVVPRTCPGAGLGIHGVVTVLDSHVQTTTSSSGQPNTLSYVNRFRCF